MAIEGSADKLRNALLHRGMTNPSSMKQSFRDLSDKEVTASYLLAALELLDINEEANLKVYNHALP